MTELQKQFEEEKGLSFTGIPINGVHLEYIMWLETQVQTLRIHNVVKLFTAEDVVKVLGDCDHLDDAIIYFNERK